MLQEKLIEAHLDVLCQDAHFLRSNVLLLLSSLRKQLFDLLLIHVVLAEQIAEVVNLLGRVSGKALNLLAEPHLNIVHILAHLS